MNVLDKFKLNNKVAIITGGGGLLGIKHAEAIAEANGTTILWDIDFEKVKKASQIISDKYGVPSFGACVDITSLESIKKGLDFALKKFSKVDILINNAANDPKAESDLTTNRFETLSLDFWEKDIAVGLTGAFLCSQVIGSHMAKNLGGVILNISSDLGVIAPNQQIYAKDNIEENKQSVKPVTYSVVKHGLIGLTKYLATYWPDKNIRANSISPGGIYNGQSEDFVKKLTALIPMARMAEIDEYKAAILFLVSDASSYMNGANLIIDGGRTCW